MPNLTTRPEWANGPFELIPTPKYEQGLVTNAHNIPRGLLQLTNHIQGEKPTDDFVEIASLMAVVHNAIIRGLNTIYLQAPFVVERDYKDFLGYCHCWFEMLEGTIGIPRAIACTMKEGALLLTIHVNMEMIEHHDMEEERFFPWIEEATGEKGLMDTNVEQHKAFHDGILDFKTYLLSLSGKESSFSPPTLISIIDSFGPALSRHLADEIPSLLALSKYGDKLPLRQLWAKQRKGKMSFAAAGRIPMFFLNLDRTFEDGLWRDWPPAPGPVKWVICHLLTYLNSGYWKFASCGTDMLPKPLYAFGGS